jgi:hypothetical protein
MLKLIVGAAVLTAVPLVAFGRMQPPEARAPLHRIKAGTTIYLFETIRIVSAAPAGPGGLA